MGICGEAPCHAEDAAKRQADDSEDVDWTFPDDDVRPLITRTRFDVRTSHLTTDYISLSLSSGNWKWRGHQ
jgi:hypothetical protein